MSEAARNPLFIISFNASVVISILISFSNACAIVLFVLVRTSFAHELLLLSSLVDELSSCVSLDTP